MQPGRLQRPASAPRPPGGGKGKPLTPPKRSPRYDAFRRGMSCGFQQKSGEEKNQATDVGNEKAEGKIGLQGL